DKHLDLGITYLPIPRGDLDFLEVTEIEMGVYALKDRFSQDPIEEIPFAVPVTPLHGSPTKVAGLDGWPEHICPRRSAYRVTLMDSPLDLCREGLAVCYLPSFVVRLHNRKVREDFQPFPVKIPLKIPSRFVRQPVFIIKRKSEGESQTIKRVAKALRLLC